MGPANSINEKTSILISRNTPLAIVVGVSGFIGSHVADSLLAKGIQVIGIADFSVGAKENLEEAIKNKRFHLVNSDITQASLQSNQLIQSLPRLDYAFYITGIENSHKFLTDGLDNFLFSINKLKDSEGNFKNIKITFLSSVRLYDNKLEPEQKNLKQAEIKLAKYVKAHNLNARIVRLSSIYGPRMSFDETDPTQNLLKLAILGDVHKVSVSLDFITRSLYIDDAVSLIIKSSLSGATAHKIYDGSLFQPVKLVDIQQILLDPLWHESKGFSPAELPPWPTPNLEKTIKELHWKPKTPLVEGLKRTLSYFEKRGDLMAKLKTETEQLKLDSDSKSDFITGYDLGKKWSFANIDSDDNSLKKAALKEARSGSNNREESYKKTRTSQHRFKLNRQSFINLTILGLIIYALVYPLVSLIIGAFTIRYHLRSSEKMLISGNFDRASQEINSARSGLESTGEVIKAFAVVKRLGIFPREIDKLEQAVDLSKEGIDGVSYAISGSQALFQTTKIISGEDKTDPRPLYQKAQLDLTSALSKLSKTSSVLTNPLFADSYPGFISYRILDLGEKLNYYRQVVEKARIASFLLPQLTAVDGLSAGQAGKKTYLVLLQNNLELRPTGGFIGSYGKLTFENGKITNIAVDDIYNLDGQLKEVIEPPIEIKNDLGVSRWYLRDSNFDPDFPTSAKQAEFFFRKEAGENVQGVIALDLTASSKLLTAAKGLNLPDYGEFVDSNNLFEKVVSHAEVSFFPGSQAKKNYLVSLQTQLFNKVFYLSNQNWPDIIQAFSDSLDQKHILVYLADPTMFSYLTSANWAGVFPRGAVVDPGNTNDFLAAVESNMGANKSNFFLERSYKLETSFSKEGQISHKLAINYKNNSPSEVFPAGKYKNRIRIYLPQNAKLTKALFGESDITDKIAPFSDYGRSGYSTLIELLPKEQKSLIIFYNLDKPLSFKDKLNSYRLEIFKQPGTGQDPFEWVLSYPINYKIESLPSDAARSIQEVKIVTDLLKDQVFSLQIRQ